MRARWLFLLVGVPVVASADPMDTAAFDTVAGSLVSMVGTVVVPIIAVLAVLLIGVKLVMGNADPAETLIKFGVPLFVVVGGLAVMRTFFGVMGVEAPAEARDSGPGFFWTAWSWLAEHLLTLGITAGVIGGASWLAARSLRKRRDSRQVKLDVRAVIETVERADALRLYWECVALAQANEGDGPLRSRWRSWLGRIRTLPSHAQDALSTMKSMQSELMPMLERAHGGSPLDEVQRKRLGFIRQELNRHMKQPDGKPLDIAAELTQLAQEPADAAPSYVASQRVPMWSPVAASGAVAAYPTSRAQATPTSVLDLLNPFNLTNLVNPLSPLSPLSPWSAWRSKERHHDTSPSSERSEWVGTGHSSESRSVSVDSSSSGGSSDTHEPDRAIECSRSDDSSSAYDPPPSWVPSDSSSSCDSAGSSSDSSSDRGADDQSRE